MINKNSVFKKINIAILAGGASNEREVSLKTGKQISLALSKEKYNILFIEITGDNKWILKNDFLEEDGKNNNFVKIKKEEDLFLINSEIFRQINLVFIALHGRNGEDGRIQSVLDLLGVPYTGSGVLASALGMNKEKCLTFIKSVGLRTPEFLVVNKNDFNFKEVSISIKKRFGFPCVVKPNESGSSIGVAVVKNEESLAEAVNLAFREDDIVLIEQYIKGREFTCGVLGNTKDNEFLLLPPVEIIVPSSNFFDYQAKYFSETTKEVCPAEISTDLSEKIKNYAKKAHESLGCDGLTRSDFILSETDNQIYFLEINTIPGQTEASLCPKEAKAIGVNFDEFVERQVLLALKKNKK